MPQLYVISGCNGAGKTTASFTVLPEMLGCTEFVNADEIARGLSPFNPEGVAIEAGRLMLHRMHELLDANRSFAFETTLATRSHVAFLKKAQAQGYQVSLLYFWLNSPTLAIQRVKKRVSEGGHNISEDVVRRRYRSGIKNLFNLYIPVCDFWIIVDNSISPFKIVANGKHSEISMIHEPSTFKLLQQYE